MCGIVGIFDIIGNLPGVRQYLIVQEGLCIQQVTDVLFEARPSGIFITEIKRKLGDPVTVQIEQGAEIKKEASGKFHYVMSKVAGMNMGARS